MTTPVRVLDNPAAAAAAAAEVVYRIADEALRQRGRFSIALAGGSTPALLYEQFARDGRARLDWDRTDVFFGDERCVPPTHGDSNFGMAQRTLIAPLHLDAARVHRLRGEVTDHMGEAARAEHDLVATTGDGAIDVVLLGLGPDGHIASLFPRSPALDVADHLYAANPAGQAPFVPRLTITFAALAKARFVIIFCTGASKADIVWRALELQDQRLPVASVHSASGPPLFILDRDAAARLSPVP